MNTPIALHVLADPVQVSPSCTVQDVLLLGRPVARIVDNGVRVLYPVSPGGEISCTDCAFLDDGPVGPQVDAWMAYRSLDRAAL